MAIKIKYVTRSNGRWVYRPRIPTSDRDIIRTDKNGFLAPPIRLGKLTDSDDEIIDAWRLAKNSLHQRTGLKKHTLRWIVDQYQKSKTFKALAIGSQKRATALLSILEHGIKIDGKPAAFGELSMRHITRPMVRRLADKRLDNYIARGRKGAAQVNREISFLSAATLWALDHIDNLGISENPFKIKKFAEPKTDRYITDDEYEIQRAEAAKLVDYLPIVFELTYLLASRGVETLDLRLSDIDPDRETGGIRVKRTKGSRENMIAWSDRLYQAYLDAHELHKKHTITAIDTPLIVGSHGQQLKKSSLDTAMHRLKQKMEKKGLGNVYFSLHKLKHKGISDAQDARIGGHKSEAMRERYQVKLEKFDPPR